MEADKIDLVWGVAAIAKIIGRSQRQTFYLVSSGALPAKQVGSRWVIERSKLIAFFTGEAA